MKILFINLDKKSYEIKAMPDLDKYIGGVGLGLKLFTQFKSLDPLIFAVGPFNGFFPFASKTAVLLRDKLLVEDYYIGGSLSFRIRFTDFMAIVISGKSKEGIGLSINSAGVMFVDSPTELAGMGVPGKSSYLTFNGDGILLNDNHFRTKDNLLGEKFIERGLFGMHVIGNTNHTIPNIERYKDLYEDILSRAKDMQVEPGNNPSCSGCPLGCSKSLIGELSGDVLVHSLVACNFAQNIYSDVGVVFSCLASLGYTYMHEDIESLPKLIKETLRELDV